MATAMDVEDSKSAFSENSKDISYPDYPVEGVGNGYKGRTKVKLFPFRNPISELFVFFLCESENSLFSFVEFE